MEWFVLIDNEQCGPYSIKQLSRYIEEGRITRDHLIWRTDLSDRKPAGQVEELARYFLPVEGKETAGKHEPEEKETLPEKKSRFPSRFVLILCLLVALGFFGFRTYAFFQGTDRSIFDPVEMTVTPAGENITGTVKIGATKVRFNQVFADDTSGDGNFDRRSYYQDDLLVLSAWDTNLDGSFDLWLRFVEGDYVNLEARDLSGDGRIDELVRVDENEVRTDDRLLVEAMRSMGLYALPVLLFLVLLILDKRKNKGGFSTNMVSDTFPDKPKKRLGCFKIFIFFILVVVLIGAGLWKYALNPGPGKAAKEFMEGPVDEIASAMIKNGLAESEIEGASVAVVPLPGGKGHAAIIVIDPVEGFKPGVGEAGKREQVMNAIKRLVETNQENNLDLQRAALEYQEDGKAIIAITAPMNVLNELAGGKVGEKEVLAQVDVKVKDIIYFKKLIDIAE